jgi:hypothetical protein
MHTGTLRKLALSLTFWLALYTTSKAQIFTNDLPLQADTTGTNPVDFEFRSDGTLIAKGNLTVGSLGSTDQGAGTRMLWYPKLAAFRAGYVSGTQWNTSSIGKYSVAFGYNNTASGKYSSAHGYSTTASGNYSTASGYGATASGYISTAFGYHSTAIGWTAMAVGTSTTASGGYSFAAGYLTSSAGSCSASLGHNTYANGGCSLTSGVVTTASSYASTAFGAGNVGGGNPTTWVATDPLFELGNGKLYGAGNPSASGTSDALVVYKNGNVKAQGVITAAPGGDIPMYPGD